MPSRRVFSASLMLGLFTTSSGCGKQDGSPSSTGNPSALATQGSTPAQQPSSLQPASPTTASTQPTASYPELQAVPTPQPTGGKTLTMGKVTVTVPTELNEVKDFGETRKKPFFYVSDDNLGLLDINIARFRFSEADVSAEDEWQAYRDDASDSISKMMKISWPGAETAWAWTWDQPADFTFFTDKAKGVVNLSGICMMLRSTSGQDLYIAAYAPKGKLAGSPALKALNSLKLA